MDESIPARHGAAGFLGTVLAGMVGVAAGCYLAHLRAEQRRREQNMRSPANPEPLQTWEGEGGAVPVGGGRTAAQVEPEVGQPAAQQANPVVPDSTMRPGGSAPGSSPGTGGMGSSTPSSTWTGPDIRH
jgi:hypothetical protein